MTKIEWTDESWNPIVGCSVVSPGCTNCYAMRMANRLAANDKTPHYAGTVQPSKAGPVWTGNVALAPDHVLTAPLRRRKPTTYFVNSMGDLFHEAVPDDWIDRVFAVMALAPQHTFQVLTKRPERARAYLSKLSDQPSEWRCKRLDYAQLAVWPLPNVWLGVSAEDQARADARIPALLATPAAIRFVSAEPLLGPVDLDSAWHGESALSGECWGDCGWCESGKPPMHNCQKGRQSDAQFFKGRDGIDWVICGGESGPGARPMHPDWARSLRDQCSAAGVPFFFKQVGAWTGWEETGSPPYWRNSFTGVEEDRHGLFPSDWDNARDWDDGLNYISEDTHVAFHRVGKRAAGRLLDGREWNDTPGRDG